MKPTFVCDYGDCTKSGEANDFPIVVHIRGIFGRARYCSANHAIEALRLFAAAGVTK